jgi:hypothetical protein
MRGKIKERECVRAAGPRKCRVKRIEEKHEVDEEEAEEEEEIEKKMRR